MRSQGPEFRATSTDSSLRQRQLFLLDMQGNVNVLGIPGVCTLCPQAHTTNETDVPMTHMHMVRNAVGWLSTFPIDRRSKDFLTFTDVDSLGARARV
jgi:hypothetical protein